MGKAVEKNLALIIPAAQLQVTQKQIVDIVKKTETEELHQKYTQMVGFTDMFVTATKDELIERAKENNNKLSTSLGTISLQTRENVTPDENKILKFLKSKKLSEELAFDFDYEVVTKNATILADLLEKGYITQTSKFNKSKFKKLAEKYPQLLKMIDLKETEYLKGL